MEIASTAGRVMTPLQSAKRQFEFYIDAPKPEADVPVRVAWLRKAIRPTVLDDTVLMLFGEPADPWDDESLQLALSIMCRLAWENAIADAALKAEQADARKKVTDLIDHMERRVRTLAIERVAGKRILEEASAIVCNSAVFVPEHLIGQLCGRVAQSRLPTARMRRG